MTASKFLGVVYYSNTVLVCVWYAIPLAVSERMELGHCFLRNTTKDKWAPDFVLKNIVDLN